MAAACLHAPLYLLSSVPSLSPLYLLSTDAKNIPNTQFVSLHGLRNSLGSTHVRASLATGLENAQESMQRMGRSSFVVRTLALAFFLFFALKPQQTRAEDDTVLSIHGSGSTFTYAYIRKVRPDACRMTVTTLLSRPLYLFQVCLPEASSQARLPVS